MNKAQELVQDAIRHLQDELKNIRSGRANPAIVEELKVESYGAQTPLNQLASISAPDASSIVIEPWDKNILSAIEKAVQESDIGIQPVNEGEKIRLSLPPLTEERRQDLVKIVSDKTEEAKISIRNVREDALKNVKNDELSEDDEEREKEDIQKIVDKANDEVEKIAETKKEDILKME